jgi:hypothetical protein
LLRTVELGIPLPCQALAAADPTIKWGHIHITRTKPPGDPVAGHGLLYKDAISRWDQVAALGPVRGQPCAAHPHFLTESHAAPDRYRAVVPSTKAAMGDKEKTAGAAS